jgi:ribonuclease HI
MAEAGTLPFELFAVQSIVRLTIQMLAKDENNSTLPLIQRGLERLEELTGTRLPIISQLVRQSDRGWHARKPCIVWDVKTNIRAGDPPGKVRPIVQQLLNTRFHRSTIVYTDGSKSEESVGAAFFNSGIARTCNLPKQCSIFSAEAYAIKMAMEIPNISNELVIFTDSASCLLALEAGTSRHPWIQEIEKKSQNRPVHFCWIPGHAGIRGNEEADRLANEARRHHANEIQVPGEDALRTAKKEIRSRWNNQWYESRDSPNFMQIGSHVLIFIPHKHRKKHRDTQLYLAYYIYLSY